MTGHVLVVRLDNDGDVLLAGPAIRAVAANSQRVTLLASPRGSQAAGLLPGIDNVLIWRAPWIDPEPSPVRPADIADVVDRLRLEGPDEALVLTSCHQSALPTALVLRLAGVAKISAISDEYSGSLLDVRHRVEVDLPEAERGLSLAIAAGYRLASGDSGRLRVRADLPDVRNLIGEDEDYVVLHPGTSAPARAWPPYRCAEAVRLLDREGYRVVVTGGRTEESLTGYVSGRTGINLGGQTSYAELAAVLSGARVVIAGNTGPAQLAAAVGTPVISLFAPTLPAARWAPYRVPHVLLGDQLAGCRGTQAASCPVAGHPCLASVTAHDVLAAMRDLLTTERTAHARRPTAKVPMPGLVAAEATL